MEAILLPNAEIKITKSIVKGVRYPEVQEELTIINEGEELIKIDLDGDFNNFTSLVLSKGIFYIAI